MKKSLLFTLSLFINYCGYSQSISPQVIATAGDHFSNTQVQLSWTIGEPIIETSVSNTSVLTQGFQQTNLTITSVEDFAQELKINIFPNPASDIINIEFKENFEGSLLRLVDGKGRTLTSRKVSLKTTIQQLNVAHISAGTYYLQLLTEDSKAIKTFKIIKLK